MTRIRTARTDRPLFLAYREHDSEGLKEGKYFFRWPQKMLLRRFVASSFHLTRFEGLQRVNFSIEANKTDGLIRNNWTREEISDIYNRPLINLIYDAATVHRMFHDPQQVQKATLLSIKTGGKNFPQKIVASAC